MTKKNFEIYLKEICQKISRGDAREESFYSILAELLNKYGQSIGKRTEVTVLPKKTEAGNPDFRVWDGQSQLTGYIEAKNPSMELLDQVESSEQIKRYLEAYPNFILTNFFEFRLYRNGNLWGKPIKISDYFLSQKIPQFPVVQHEEEFKKLLDFFYDFVQPSITQPKSLAEVLACKTGIMRDYVVSPTIKESQDNYFGWLYQSFKEHLIKDLESQVFADLFSQTFTYGLVIAKYQYEAQQTLFGKKISKLPFTTKTAYDFIQEKFGILREVFKIISTQKMPKDLAIITDDIVDILNHTEIYKLLSRSSKGGKKDPIFHLYETFLLKYDKERKIKLGVFYTPLEIVSYIVNSVHTLLKDSKLFDAPDGLASYKPESIEKSVTLLDPAVGTGTFFVNAIEKAVEEVKTKRSSSKNIVSDFVRKHILPHFFAFEIQIAPYVVNHLKTLFSLTNEGFEFTDDDYLRIFLTNTLEFHHKEISKGYAGFFERVLVTEQEKALDVKSKTPIMVVVGNPPYSVSSQNAVDPQTDFGKFYEGYKENVRKEEKNIQPLSDDYIKFLAFAHWKVQKTGKGIVGMITNNSYLDGIIHRDMRKKLLCDFDLIYIFNLHGDAKKLKISDDGRKDENVFDIRQGVAIGLFVKPEKQIKKQIFYQELMGLRDEKYKYLNTYNVKTSKWEKLKPKEPYWFFVPKDFELEKKYNKFLSLTEIFEKGNVGIATGKDTVLVTLDKNQLRRNLSIKDKEVFELFLRKSKVKEQLVSRWYEILEETNLEDQIFPYSYRPFDTRFTIYNAQILQRTRKELMDNFLHPEGNIALCVTNRSNQKTYNEVFISDKITDKHLTGHQTYIFPLWFYNNKNHENGENQDSLLTPSANIKIEIIKQFSSNYNREISPEEIFYYIYAILYSEKYRKKYEEFLKIDFPKVPFTKNHRLFKKISALGKELAKLHLLKSSLLSKTSSRFEGENEGIIKKPSYNEKLKRVYINESQYFTNVGSEVWNYYIGGYQILAKWLKDRKKKTLTDEEAKHYIKVIAAIENTIKIQKEIDKYYKKIGDSLLIIVP